MDEKTNDINIQFYTENVNLFMNIPTFLMFGQIQLNKAFKYCDAIIDEAVCLFRSPW